ncbi:hypothetical protein Tco_0250584 [Tanacetum coccineum]
MIDYDVQCALIASQINNIHGLELDFLFVLEDIIPVVEVDQQLKPDLTVFVSTKSVTGMRWIWQTISLTVGTDLTIKLQRESKKPCCERMSDQSETLVRQGSARNRGCGHRSPSAYMLRKYPICVHLVYVLRHPSRSQLISGLSGGLLGFHDSFSSFAVVCFFRGRLLLRDASLYLLGEACGAWTLLGLSSSD